MNPLLASAFTEFFENLFSNWTLVCFIIFTILLVLSIIFRHYKLAFLILIIAASAIGVALLTVFIIDAVSWDLYGFIDFVIAWGPTILFSLIVVLSTLVNAYRGRRKSLIYLLHSACAAVLWLLLFYFGVRSEKIDSALLKFVNLFMGENGLQNSLNVSAETTTLRGVLTLYMENIGGDGPLTILLSESSAYLYTLADMAYHIIFAIICYIFYLLTLFVLFIIYHCAYSERKYKRKRNAKFNDHLAETPYKKHRTGGAVVGLVRGIAMALVFVSFIGGIFYIVAGGKGKGKLKNYEISGQYEQPLKIYRSIESYGTNGIFMILNAMSDPNDMPYYLFAADLVFSGELDDDRNELDENVNLRGELGTLTGFARETIMLLYEYGSEELKNVVNGTSQNSMQDILSVMKKEEFRKEFDLLIDSYDSPTYLYNFTLSLVTSVLAHIDELSFGSKISDRNKELFKIMFKEGYLSKDIPEDRILYDYNVAGLVKDPWQTTGRNVRPYLSVQQLVTKEDMHAFINLVLTFLDEKDKGAGMLDLLRALIPDLKKLSMFEGGRNSKLNPVMARVYCYAQNSYLKAEGDNEGYSYHALLGENVNWIDELEDLIDTSEDIFALYDDVRGQDVPLYKKLLYVFDEENPNREKDIVLYDRILERLSDSSLMGKTLASGLFHQKFTDSFNGLFAGFYLSKDLKYENSYADDGSLLQNGELYYFLKGIRHVGTMEDRTLLDLMFNGTDMSVADMLDAVACCVKEKDDDGNDFVYYSTQSELLRSLISSMLIQKGADNLYVPNVAKETDEEGNRVNLIVKSELEGILNKMDLVSKFIKDCVDGDYYANIDKYLDDAAFMSLLEDNRIVEGSVALHISRNLGEAGSDGNTYIVMPEYLKGNTENWISANGVKGELLRFIDAYRTIREEGGKEETGEYKLNLENIMSGEKKDYLLETVSNLGSTQTVEERRKTLEEFFGSDVVYYTVSSYLDSMDVNGLSIIVPKSAMKSVYAQNGLTQTVIKKEELCDLFTYLNELGVTNVTDRNELLWILLTKSESIRGEILSASVVRNIVNCNDNWFTNTLSLRDLTVSDTSDLTYFEAGQDEYLTQKDYGLNPWKEELPHLIGALHALFAGSIGETGMNDGFEFNYVTLAMAIMTNSSDPVVMEACQKSRIIWSIAGPLLSAEG